MTKGLLKSFSLHFVIIILFMYGAEIFKKNKRFEINEIPLEIVDISDKTVNKIEPEKKEKKSKLKQNKKNQTFQPPSIQSKPKPPEFKIDNKKKKKVTKKNNEEKQKKRVDNILKSIEKIKSENNKKKQAKQTANQTTEDKKIDDKKDTVNIPKLGEKLTISEKDAIRRQFYRCWIVPAGAKNIKDYKVSIKLKLNNEGEVISSKIINKINSNNTFFRTLAESAIRAVNHPDCKKLKVPSKKYETWKETILDFDPSIMIN